MIGNLEVHANRMKNKDVLYGVLKSNVPIEQKAQEDCGSKWISTGCLPSLEEKPKQIEEREKPPSMLSKFASLLSLKHSKFHTNTSTLAYFIHDIYILTYAYIYIYI